MSHIFLNCFLFACLLRQSSAASATQEQYIEAPNGNVENEFQFGETLAMSDTVLAVTQASNMFIYDYSGSEYVLAYSELVTTYTYGARAVAVYGNIVVIMCYVYQKDSSGQWYRSQNLVNGDGVECGTSGFPVGHAAMDASTAVLSSRNDGQCGNAVVQSISGGIFTYVTTLSAPDCTEAAEFGFTSAVYGSDIAIGAPELGGALYLYSSSSGSWVHTQTFYGTEEISVIGTALSLSGDKMTAGAYDIVRRSGAIYNYVKVSGSWSYLSYIQDGTAAYAQYDYTVHIDTTGEIHYLMVGDPEYDEASNNEGAVIYYEWDGANWIEQTRILAPQTPDNDVGDYFGVAVGSYGSKAAFGAPLYGDQDGAVYAYSISSGTAAPTEAPTPLPTSQPSISHTPTASPTTAAPTGFPTGYPSGSPTISHPPSPSPTTAQPTVNSSFLPFDAGDDDSEELSDGQIAGIAVASVLSIAGASALVYYFFIKPMSLGSEGLTEKLTEFSVQA